MAVASVVLLLAGSAVALVGSGRRIGWLGPAAIAAVASIATVVAWHDVRTTSRDLANPLAFLVLAVPLAVLLDRTGFFAAVAQRVGHARHLVLGLWLFAAAVTIVFNLDAAVVLLTPLYVRIAVRHDRDPVLIGFIPALMASLASSVLPVSNLTNLIVAGRLDLGVTDFLANLGLPSLAAIAIGGWCYRRTISVTAPVAPTVGPTENGPGDDGSAASLGLGLAVVVWLLAGFVVGERVGVPAWAVAGIALAALMARTRSVPWREVPYEAAVLAVGLGVLATGAAAHMPVRQLLALRGTSGEFATIGAMALGSNAINNLPATLVALPQLDVNPDRAWAVLLGVNLGPTLWVTGALSTLLWQATMRRLGHPVSAGTYARIGVRVGLPAIVAAAATHVVVQRLL